MTGLFFVDTNLLVYRRDLAEPIKQPLAAAWLEALWAERAGRLSVQVLNEYYHVVTRRLRPGIPPEEAQQEIREFLTWAPVPLTGGLLEQAWLVEQRWHFSYWDSLIVAAARHVACQYLLTEDMQEGQDLGGLRVVNPFHHAPVEYGFAAHRP
jgi:predicted nucleic acid-binding protein